MRSELRILYDVLFYPFLIIKEQGQMMHHAFHV